jgi:hypothetical protein
MKRIIILIIALLLLALVGCNETTTTTSTTLSSSNTTASEINVLDLKVEYQYSIHSTLDLWVQIPQDGEVLKVQSQTDLHDLVQNEDYQESDNSVTILHDYLSGLSVGTYELTIESTVGIFEIEIEMIDTWEPYLMQVGSIYYEIGKDLTLHFELFGGSINSLSGNDITLADYTVDGYNVIIDGDYIHQMFVSTPERTALILAYTISFNSATEIGYLFIKP